MLNTNKLLYILPDVAYLAELMPDKKPSTFTIESFRQINGDYMDEDNLKPESILKLFQKLEPKETYQLILPDFLFTNTIVNVDAKSDSKIKQYLTEELLPDLDLDPDTHQIDTTVLTEHGDKTRVQLSALEKSLLEPIQVSAQQTKVTIKNISPLSWTMKSLISLEPSISVVQISSQLYVALHYIGVDQTSQASVDKVENIYETIKTFKGSESSIQTVYLLSNESVEKQLKEHLSDTLPIQQLASKQDDDSKIPSYVKKAIETSMRTLSISDYPVPQFELGEAPQGASIEVSTNEPENNQKKADSEIKKSDLPKPQKTTTTTEIVTKSTDKKVVETEKDEQREDDEIEALLASLKTDGEEAGEEKEKKEVTQAVDNKKSTNNEAASKKADTKTKKKVIKNKNRTKNMLKMIFVTLVVFFATVGAGIGIGLGVLQLTQPSQPEEPVGQVAEVTPTPKPTVEPTPTPTPEPELDKAELSILVVNATTQAGYAGENADKLDAAEFGTVKASNAKGDYDAGGWYVLLAKPNQALVSTLKEAIDQELTVKTEGKEIEDPKAEYDAVIVLAN